MPVPPRPPAPRPCFLPRPCVRLPRNLRVLETILALLDEHPHEERIDRPSAVAEVPAVVESALDAAKSPARRRQTEDGPELPDVGEAHSSGASSSFGSSTGPSVRASPSTAISSRSSPGGGPSATTGGASIFRVKTCSAPALILSRSDCSDRTLTFPVCCSAANVASA